MYRTISAQLCHAAGLLKRWFFQIQQCGSGAFSHYFCGICARFLCFLLSPPSPAAIQKNSRVFAKSGRVAEGWLVWGVR
jgi:hypothetical protein